MNTKANPAPRYRSAISECNFSFCAHYSDTRRRCSLRKCFYDRVNVDSELNRIQRGDELCEMEGTEEWDG